MENIIKMKIQDKIKLLEHIKKHYGFFESTWTPQKVYWLDDLITKEIRELGNFKL